MPRTLTRTALTAALTLAAPALACPECGCADAAAPATPAASDHAAAAAAAEAVSAFELDRRAILAMAGKFSVSFNFHETVARADGYELAEPYHSEAEEWVLILEDAGDFISLQHLLVVRTDDGDAHVVKHWRQDWRYEDADVFAYVGDRVFDRETLASGAVSGTWTQAVYQVDDSPRYEAVGRWEHAGDSSAWTSEVTRRPLPRRELDRASEYDVFVSTNRHVVTPDGWVHEQDNRKAVLNDAGEVVSVLAHEAGVNHYTRDDTLDLSPAEDYWAQHAAYWRAVRASWGDALADADRCVIATTHNGSPVYSHLFDLAESVGEGERTIDEAAERTHAVIADAVRPAPVPEAPPITVAAR